MVLRRYSRMAQQEHWCYNCCMPIFPGEEYEATVETWRVGKRRGLVVNKRHVNPECDWPPDPDLDDEKDLEKSEDLAKAA